MATVYNNISYFPLSTSFFQRREIELLEAKFGIVGSFAALKILTRIYGNCYFLHWSEEDAMITARNFGNDYTPELITRIVEFLVEKDFFDKESYEKHHILTAKEFQLVWLEATSRRKRDLNDLPYIIISEEEIEHFNKPKRKSSPKAKSKKDEATYDANAVLKQENVDIFDANAVSNQKNVDISVANAVSNQENVDIFRQSKVKESKVNESRVNDSKEDRLIPPSDSPRGKIEEDERREKEIILNEPVIPDYAYNLETHNYEGMCRWLKEKKIIDTKHVSSIMRLTDYGRKNTAFWSIKANTKWSQINDPARYLIAMLTSKKPA